MNDDHTQPSWIRYEDGALHVTGDPVIAEERFIHATGDRILIATSLGELTDAMRSLGIAVRPSPFGVSHLLNTGFVPVPHTALEGVVRLAAGDEFTATASGSGIDTDLTLDFPWLPSRSPEDQVPDTATLRNLLGKATEAALGRVGGSASLLLSSGKDSVSLAMSLADTGNTDVPTYTFTAYEADVEYQYAEQLTRRLGLRHDVVTMPNSDPATTRAILRFFTESPRPSTDMTILPFAWFASEIATTEAVFDGSGNDSYMGFRGTRRTRTKSRLRVRPRRVSDLVRRRIPLDSPMNYLTRSRIGAFLPLRLFRPFETGAFYPEAIDTDDYWYEQSALPGNFDELLASTEVRHTDSARSCAKAHIACEAAGRRALFPWADQAIADYYFGLPENERLDRRTGKNKLLLRRLLAEAIDYDPAEVGSNHFRFDSVGFILANHDLIRSEILECSLWNNSIEPMLDGWFDALESRPMHNHAIHALFVVSGWHNHSRHLTR